MSPRAGERIRQGGVGSKVSRLPKFAPDPCQYLGQSYTCCQGSTSTLITILTLAIFGALSISRFSNGEGWANGLGRWFNS